MMKRKTQILQCAAAAALSSAATAAVIAVLQKTGRERELREARTDSLTGIGNTGYYHFVFDRLIPKPERCSYCVAYLALEKARARNTLSPQETAEIQCGAARRLTEILLPDEFIARIRTGVFAFVYRAEHPGDAKRRIEEVLGDLNVFGATIRPKYADFFRAGVFELRDDPGCSAEYALNAAKQGYTFTVTHKLLYTMASPELLQHNADEDRLRLSISKAIENGEFAMYLQFIVEKSTEKICGAEVLSRWNNSEFGLMSPARYIGLMRKTGAVTEHDYYMFGRICALLESWKGTQYADLFLDCNFTRISVSEEHFADRIREIACRYDFDHSKLVIEITEDSLTENSRVADENMRRCREMGFKLALDDMGSGFSSIADFCAAEIDLVKIDRSIAIGGVTEKGRKLLDGIIALSHKMNAKALCEGIETEEQKAMIRETDCDYIQGFAYSRALPFDEALRFLQERL